LLAKKAKKDVLDVYNVTISVGDVGQGLILVSSSEGNRSHMETRA